MFYRQAVPAFRRSVGGALCAVVMACMSQPSGSPDSGAAAAREPAAAANLGGMDWRLVELDGAPALPASGESAALGQPFLRFEPDSGRVGGNTGCNHLGGRYEQSGERLSFLQLISTKRACVEDDRMRQESRFLAALEATDRHRVSSDTLTLYEGDRARARFASAAPR